MSFFFYVDDALHIIMFIVYLPLCSGGDVMLPNLHIKTDFKNYEFSITRNIISINTT
jgi:hypothetical protein